MAAVEEFVNAGVDEAVLSKGRAVLAGILDAIRALPDDAQLSDLDRALVGRVASNKLERTVLLEALGYAGILTAKGHPAYADEFITYDEAQSRQPPEPYKREWAYPVRFWSGAYGVIDRGVVLI